MHLVCRALLVLVCTASGYAQAPASSGQTQSEPIEPQPPVTVEEHVTVSATRTDKRLEDQAMRVEVLGREEIEEKMLMTPGDIVMMLNEMGGMRVQATSPSLGAASVRIQGMRGRYTRVFSDGLPLFGEVGGLGLLQIPPMDLGQVEVIKGVASSLYGAGAMGGVVNLISRRPGRERQRELLINQSTRGATDAVAWYATPARTGWTFTFLGGGHRQTQNDVNDDQWTDLAGYSRAVARPRVFWDDGKGRTFFATAGVTAEDREGGGTPDGTRYVEALDTRRVDAGAVGQILLRQRYVLGARAAVMLQRHDHRFGDLRERDRHETAFGEVTLRAPAGRHTLVAGAAVERDAYRPTDLPQFRYTFTVPGVFIQDDVDLARWVSVSASARLDHHSEYGTFVSPRASALLRAGAWTSRLSIGTGFFGPSPLTEETEAAGLSRLVIPRPLRAEEGRSASLDIGRTDGPLSYSLTLFSSRVRRAIDVDRSQGLVLTNRSAPSTNTGVEALGTFRHEPYAVTATYTFVQAHEVDDGRRQQAELTPRHSAGLVGMWEREGVGRLGIELYYTGVQRLEENPFRAISRPYVILGLLAERQVRRVRLFVNGENLTGVRQTRWDPLIRPTRAPDGRWTVDAWAPLEGVNVNGGIRLGW
ncbi:MAG TPA: TonB-dependent receptor [Vicinamibacterales bacterium]|jgi:iron complex outermembrane receptor protein|nr:TonB-dependent receptor [Vicinamibacterales bacterium]